MLSKQITIIISLCLLASTEVFAQSTPTGLSQRVDALEQTTAQQQIEIQQNSANIATNAAAIDQNSTDIATNAADISQNMDGIYQNWLDIQALQQAVAGGGSGSGGGSGWVLKDKNGNTVGNAVSILSRQVAVVELTAGGQSFVTLVHSDGFLDDGYQILFPTNDCSGTTVYSNSWFAANKLLGIGLIFTPDPNDPTKQIANAYEVAGGQISNAFIGSYIGWDGTCAANTAYYADVVPVSLLETTDFNSQYPEPYHLAK